RDPVEPVVLLADDNLVAVGGRADRLCPVALGRQWLAARARKVGAAPGACGPALVSALAADCQRPDPAVQSQGLDRRHPGHSDRAAAAGHRAGVIDSLSDAAGALV